MLLHVTVHVTVHVTINVTTKSSKFYTDQHVTIIFLKEIYIFYFKKTTVTCGNMLNCTEIPKNQTVTCKGNMW